MRGKLLIVEDQPDIRKLIRMTLEFEGYDLLEAENGAEGLHTAQAARPAIILLDVMMPGELDGYQVCAALRAGSDVPVLMLTARDDEDDRIAGFDAGADDYLVKPFSPRELVVRVRAILRRCAVPATPGGNVIVVGIVEVDVARREARVGGEPVALAAREFDLLAHLAANRGQALTRPQLLDGAWGQGWMGDERTVDVHVRQLRKKLGDGLPLATVWGTGYRLD